MRLRASGARRALWIVFAAAAVVACGNANRTATGSGRCHNGVCQGDPAGASSGGGGASDASAGNASDASATDAAPATP